MTNRKTSSAFFAVGMILSMSALALTCTAGCGSLDAQYGSLAHCPEANKWAISAWGGEDGEDTGQALATCGEGSVAAAYFLDPHDQVWSRWFLGRPEISNLSTLNYGQGVITLGRAASVSPAVAAEPGVEAAGGMLGCPEPGKWAISVWAGASGTATGEALAGCVGTSVAAAYWLDPETQEWKRYFDGRPDISNLTTLDEMQGFFALGGGPGPTPTPEGSPSSPTPTAGTTTATPTATPPGGLQLRLVGPGSVDVGSAIELSIRLEGDAVAFAAFNFDVVYDQALVSLGTPEAALNALNTADRTFQCDLLPPSGDVDPNPQVGRARLVCFSFGGPEAPAPSSPTTVAAIQLTGTMAGSAELRFENVAFFTPDASPIAVAPQSATVLVE
jgi:hypothetical protein